MLNDHCKPKEHASDAITSLRQQVETLQHDVSIWKASSEKWAQRHAEVHAQVETLTQERDEWRSDCIEIGKALAHQLISGGWRCFFCWSNFTDEREARAHFGDHSGERPACLKRGEVTYDAVALAKTVAIMEQQLASLAAAQERMTEEWHEIADTRRAGTRLLTLEAAQVYDRCAAQLEALPSLAASSRETTDETKDDARQSSPSPVRTTGSPREPTKGSER